MVRFARIFRWYYAAKKKNGEGKERNREPKRVDEESRKRVITDTRKSQFPGVEIVEPEDENYSLPAKSLTEWMLDLDRD
ncbi:hypothetical protein [Desulforhopalus singaporensis]|uniref:Uncharacterized protein n=1 Tax=Desulforhopalus singaporensis TaxID=91360 RepID=A0A1H0K271_9BACT|nr:hypothetical protein [Desulforhopalus singaporensis]SDO50115.1 hypothetical protein SAMN05660330_00415 [Desulforhopalus singaporensis]